MLATIAATSSDTAIIARSSGLRCNGAYSRVSTCSTTCWACAASAAAWPWAISCARLPCTSSSQACSAARTLASALPAAARARSSSAAAIRRWRASGCTRR
ncbi:hypothetical protein G6F68_014655 [Rhizopus microsporus]|nr:hypothetical protein G6F68_014655 [Rhizopus microsporus]